MWVLLSAPLSRGHSHYSTAPSALVSMALTSGTTKHSASALLNRPPMALVCNTSCRCPSALPQTCQRSKSWNRSSRGVMQLFDTGGETAWVGGKRKDDKGDERTFVSGGQTWWCTCYKASSLQIAPADDHYQGGLGHCCRKE
jgi:hypothetical protein